MDKSLDKGLEIIPINPHLKFVATTLINGQTKDVAILIIRSDLELEHASGYFEEDNRVFSSLDDAKEIIIQMSDGVANINWSYVVGGTTIPLDRCFSLQTDYLDKVDPPRITHSVGKKSCDAFSTKKNNREIQPVDPPRITPSPAKTSLDTFSTKKSLDTFSTKKSLDTFSTKKEKPLSVTSSPQISLPSQDVGPRVVEKPKSVKGATIEKTGKKPAPKKKSGVKKKEKDGEYISQADPDGYSKYNAASDMFAEWFQRIRDKHGFPKEQTCLQVWNSLPEHGISKGDKKCRDYWDNKFYYDFLGPSWEQKPVYDKDGKLLYLMDRPMPGVRYTKSWEDELLEGFSNMKFTIPQIQDLPPDPKDWTSKNMNMFFDRADRFETLDKEPVLYGIRARVRTKFDRGDMLLCVWGPSNFDFTRNYSYGQPILSKTFDDGPYGMEGGLVQNWVENIHLMPFEKPEYRKCVKEFNKYCTDLCGQLLERFYARIVIGDFGQHDVKKALDVYLRTKYTDMGIFSKEKNKPYTIGTPLLYPTSEKKSEIRHAAKSEVEFKRVLKDWMDNERKLIPVGDSDDWNEQEIRLGNYIPVEKECPYPCIWGDPEDKLLLQELIKQNAFVKLKDPGI